MGKKKESMSFYRNFYTLFFKFLLIVCYNSVLSHRFTLAEHQCIRYTVEI